MGSFEIGAVPPLMQFGPERATARWADIREAMAPVLELLRRD